MNICLIWTKLKFIISFSSQVLSMDTLYYISSTHPSDGHVQIHALAYIIVCCLVRQITNFYIKRMDIYNCSFIKKLTTRNPTND